MSKYKDCGHATERRFIQKNGFSVCGECKREGRRRRYANGLVDGFTEDARFDADVCNRCGDRVPGVRAMVQHKSTHDGAINPWQPLWRATAGWI
jgi:hypothetical protein